jgi:RHS repeat-associated protein
MSGNSKRSAGMSLVQWLRVGVAFCLALVSALAIAQTPAEKFKKILPAINLLLLAGETVEVYNIHTDHLNTPRLITNQAGQAVWRWDNDDPFGNNPPNENPSGLGTFEFPLRDAGTYFDKETGLLHNWNRYRDPPSGRFIQADPLGLAGGDLSLYALRKNNPLSFTDPTGEAPWILIGAGVGALYEAIKKARDPCSSWGDIGLAALGGAVSGGIAAAAPVAALGRGLGIAGAVGFGTTFGAAGSILGQGISNRGAIDPGAVALNAALGGVGGGLGNIAGLASSLSVLRSSAVPTAAAAVAQGKSVGTGVSYYYGVAVDAVAVPPPPGANSCSCMPR